MLLQSILDGCAIVDNLVNGTREGQRDLGRQLKKMFESVGIFTSCPITVQNVTITDYVIHIGDLDPALNVIADVSYYLFFFLHVTTSVKAFFFLREMLIR